MVRYSFFFLHGDREFVPGFEVAETDCDKDAMTAAARRLDTRDDANEVEVFDGARKVGWIKRLAEDRSAVVLLH